MGLLFAVAGCGPAPTRSSGDGSKPVQEDSVAIQAGPVEGELPGAWTMKAEESSMRFQGEEESSAIVQRVTGQLLKDGKVASNFVADSGEADTKTGRLVLTGHVKVTSERDGVVLVAERLTYDKNRALLFAEGRVEVQSDAWLSGPFAKLVATPGLERIGTPDRF